MPIKPPPPPHLTPEQYEKLNSYVQRCAQILKLGNWDLSLSHYPCRDDWSASMQATAQILSGTLRVAGPDNAEHHFLHNTRAEIRQDIAHELLHCHFAPIDDVSVEHIRALELLPSSTFQAHKLSYNLAMETTIHVLSLVIAELLPLPEFGSDYKEPEPVGISGKAFDGIADRTKKKRPSRKRK